MSLDDFFFQKYKNFQILGIQISADSNKSILKSFLIKCWFFYNMISLIWIATIEAYFVIFKAKSIEEVAEATSFVMVTIDWIIRFLGIYNQIGSCEKLFKLIISFSRGKLSDISIHSKLIFKNSFLN